MIYSFKFNDFLKKNWRIKNTPVCFFKKFVLGKLYISKSYQAAAKYRKEIKNILSLESTGSSKKAGFSVKPSPPKISNNATVIKSSASAHLLLLLQ